MNIKGEICRNTWEDFIYFLLILLFNYSCLHFLPTPLSHPIIRGDFNTSLTLYGRSSIQKINKETMVLNDTRSNWFNQYLQSISPQSIRIYIIQLPSKKEPIRFSTELYTQCRITHAYFKTHHYFLLVFLLQMVFHNSMRQPLQRQGSDIWVSLTFTYFCV